MDAFQRPTEKPVERSALRAKCGLAYYGLLRRMIWIGMSGRFASARAEELPFPHFQHRAVLLRRLKDVDMQYQYNKIVNLRIAAKKLNGITVRPGEIFSYWKTIGKPTRSKGYVDGMVLNNGGFGYGVGGGLCQMSNLIYWMTLHTPLTVIERHRHGYDVFPDSDRTQPFGSGATCFYPHGDLMIRNDTNESFRLSVWLDDEYLNGQWSATAPPELSYEIVERNHEITSEYWGGFCRHNELFRQTFSLEGELVREELVAANHALMMYSPFLSEAGAASESGDSGK